MIEGLAAKRAGDLAAAPLAARERHRRAVAQPGDVEFLEQPLELLGAHGLVGLDQLEHAGDVLRHGHAAEDRGLLRQVAEAEDRAAVHRQLGDVDAVHQDAPESGRTRPMIE
jgi:hypothetical protein